VQPRCSFCRARILADEISIQRCIAKCRACHAVFTVLWEGFLAVWYFVAFIESAQRIEGRPVAEDRFEPSM